ncbi:Acyltransferase family protein [Rickettsia bellii OSU 85-389]|uniref:acyltransferase family protein n=1 Tax=Rickettsia bellii TaxID=33990 RepID=UPI0000DB0D6F|nr:acyltransferase [Rickettsia bellii]ABV78419.1 Acyltransferase family protein [Rickettsia bellii OSU 85-389]
MQKLVLLHVQKRDELIDVLRGIAIILVLILHFHLSYTIESWNFNFLMHGNYGVTIFFVISGYLISTNALKRYGDLASIDIKHFYLLRCARILPPLFFALIIISLFYALDLKSFINLVYKDGVNNPSLGLTIFSVLTFWHNVMMDYYGYFNYAINIYWSLSVEEFFYLIFPLACVILRNRKLIIFILISIIAISPIYRYMNRNDEIIFMYSYLACSDAISIGILSALLKSNIKYFPQKNLIRVFGFSLIGFVYFILGIHGFEAIGFSLVSLGTGLIIISSYSQTFKSNVVSKLLSFLGKISYELYLFHIIILGLIRGIIVPKNLSGLPAIGLLSMFLFCSVLISYLISRFYSEPINRFFRRCLMAKYNC